MKDRGRNAGLFSGLAYLSLFLSFPVFFIMTMNPSGEHHRFSSNEFYICSFLPATAMLMALISMVLATLPGASPPLEPARSLEEGRVRRLRRLERPRAPERRNSPWLLLCFFLPVFLIGWFELGYAYEGTGTMIPFYGSMKLFIDPAGPPSVYAKRMGLAALTAILWPAGCRIVLLTRILLRSAHSGPGKPDGT